MTAQNNHHEVTFSDLRARIINFPNDWAPMSIEAYALAGSGTRVSLDAVNTILAQQGIGVFE